MMNYLAILVAAIASMIMGSIWYSKILFANAWIKLSGAKEMKLDVKSMIMMFISTLVMGVVIAFLIGRLRITTPRLGFIFGLVTWLGFVATTTLGTVLWDKKPWKLYFLNNGYNLLSMIVMSLIIAVWQ